MKQAKALQTWVPYAVRAQCELADAPTFLNEIWDLGPRKGLRGSQNVLSVSVRGRGWGHLVDARKGLKWNLT